MPRAVPKIIAFKVTNGSEGEYVKATNVTSGGTIRIQLNSNKEALINQSNSDFTWNEKDLIHGSISGRINQSAEKIINNGGCTFNFTSSATTTIANILL